MPVIIDQEFQFQLPQGFVVLEGPNGAGKSTLLRGLAAYAESLGIEPRTTFEPGDTELGAEIRKILLSGQARSAEAELFLFAADRAQHVSSVIRPTMEAKQLVLSDRYLYSTEAFQGFGRGISRAMLQTVNKIAVSGTLPDLVFLLDLEPELGLQRARSRASADDDSFEDEEIAFHDRLRKGFLELAESRPEPFVVLDAAQSEDRVLEDAAKIFRNYLDALSAHWQVPQD